MTQPDSDAQDAAFDRIASIAAGNQNLVNQPHLVSGLLAANATPQEAQTVNQLAGASYAAQMVDQARKAGAKIQLTMEQERQLAAAKVHYADVLQAPSQGWSWGGFFHDLVHNPVVDVFSEAGNFVNSLVSLTADGSVVPGTKANEDFSRAARAQGYDPDNIMSTLAYMSSGHAQLAMQDLYKHYDPDQVDLAVKFANNDKFQDQYLGDPNITVQELQRREQQLADPKFQTLVAQVSARHATFGQWAMEPASPTEQPGKANKIIASAIDLLVGAKLDPTMIVGNTVNKIRLTPITLESMDDANKVRSILTTDEKIQVKGSAANQVRRGFQSLIDNTKAMREALDKGDEVAAGQAMARIRHTTPGLVHLVDDFNGMVQAKGFAAAGSKDLVRFGEGDPITDLNQAGEYLASRYGMVRLFSGRPSAEIGLMPGQLSMFGYKKLAGATAAFGVKTSAIGTRYTLAKNFEKASASLSKYDIDLNEPGMAAKVMPAPGDRVDAATGEIIEGADQGSTLLASQRRAQDAAALRGEARFIAQQGIGIPATLRRFRQVAQRFVSRLPSTRDFSTSSADTVENVFRHARIELTNSDSYITAAKYSVADEGTRKSILTALNLQSMHAAGFGSNEIGRSLLDKARQELTHQTYTVSGSRYLDRVTGEERDTAMFGGQTNEFMRMSGFNELQKFGAKQGIWQNTVGRGLNSMVVNNMLQLIRNGWITSYASALRNSIEEQFGEGIRGGRKGFHGMIAAKYALDETGALPPTVLKSLSKKTRAGNLAYGHLTRLAAYYRHAAINTADESEGIAYILDLDPEQFAKWADDYMSLHMKSMLDPAGVDDVTEITTAGWKPARVRYVDKETGKAIDVENRRVGFEPVDAGRNAETFNELHQGAEAYAGHLATITNKSLPQTLTILKHLEDPSATTIDDVLASLKEDVAWSRISRRSNMYRNEDGEGVPIVTKADRDLADMQIARGQVREWKYLLSKEDGELNGNVVDYIRQNGKAPGTDWIMDNVPAAERPEAALKAMWEAIPVEETRDGIVKKLLDASAHGYKYIVERPLARQATLPIFAANYGRMRHFISPFAGRLLNEGLEPKIVEDIAQRIGMQMAANRTLKYIDNPAYRTQMDVVGRSFFAFQRATEAFIRRWGTQFVENPVRLRRAMLGYEAGLHSGLIYTDENGQRSFMYPGSGFAINAMLDVGKALHIPGVAPIPGVTPNLSSKFSYLNSGLQNPTTLGLTPLGSMALRSVAKIFPSMQENIDQIDRTLNGDLSPKQKSLKSELMPSMFKKFADAMDNDSRDSLMANSFKSAAYNLAAAGKFPGADADPAEMQNYVASLRVGIKNQLFLRAVFGIFAPAAPSAPTEETAGSKADWFMASNGVGSLKAEYRQMLNEYGYDKANQMWADLHPDKLVYEVGTTESATKGATLQATAASEKWMVANLGFMKGYKDVSAYFVPQYTQFGDFSLDAYHVEQEIGLRQNKTVEDFANQVATANAAQMYYKAIDARDSALQQRPDQASKIHAAFADWKREFMGLNPLFAATQADYSQAQQTAGGQLTELRHMVANNDAPAEVPTAQVAKMIQAYDQYHSLANQLSGNSNKEQALRAQLQSEYSGWMKQMVAANPQLAGLYSGVFRTLDVNVLDPLSGGV